MRYKGLSFGFALLALVLFMGTAALAEETPQSKSITPGAGETHQGKVVAAGAGKLTMEDLRGNMQRTFEVAANTNIMCESKKCGLSDVKMGDMVMVTVDNQGDKIVATKIEVKKADMAS